ncbi:MAG: hypothetical protein Q7R93_00445 [bacterium]|nr:hypothetical protein [bacterium]
MKKIKVLVVEDSHLFANEIEKLLKKAGYKSFILKEFTQKNYRAGLEFKPDVALLDHDLVAGLTGKMVAEDLKMPAKCLVSISTGLFDVSYCGQRFMLKDRLCGPGITAKKAERYAELLMKTITEATQKQQFVCSVK